MDRKKSNDAQTLASMANPYLRNSLEHNDRNRDFIANTGRKIIENHELASRGKNTVESQVPLAAALGGALGGVGGLISSKGNLGGSGGKMIAGGAALGGTASALFNKYYMTPKRNKDAVLEAKEINEEFRGISDPNKDESLRKKYLINAYLDRTPEGRGLGIDKGPLLEILKRNQVF